MRWILIVCAGWLLAGCGADVDGACDKFCDKTTECGGVTQWGEGAACAKSCVDFYDKKESDCQSSFADFADCYDAAACDATSGCNTEATSYLAVCGITPI